ncbi:hypothetical protein J21TS3_52750 [Paenibacillus cookii]|uniref:Uncharacterized protein n=1 Tax=Paenibacillus cookii TaxID=157839 RepID=A0ABQ4M4R6_9BACL|nr:hypothetical protein J21TS3_52750 [Paenibacillus cookii]
MRRAGAKKDEIINVTAEWKDIRLTGHDSRIKEGRHLRRPFELFGLSRKAYFLAHKKGTVLLSKSPEVYLGTIHL